VQPEKADVRIVAATNRDLKELVREGRFREDLYFRISVIGIRLPPLRERLEDVPLLVEHFIARFNRLLDRRLTGISDAALSLLMAYRFPGNIRELENAIEHAFVLCREGEIRPEHLPEQICARELSLERGPGRAEGTASLEQVEAAFLLEALRRNNNNCREAARSLGMHRTTLYRKMRRLGLPTPGAAPR
jgi:transcriptional regulator with PAS, ATPase and Fis domain